MAKKNPIEEKLAKTQAKMAEQLKAKKENKSYKPVKEQYAEIKESMKPKVQNLKMCECAAFCADMAKNLYMFFGP